MRTMGPESVLHEICYMWYITHRTASETESEGAAVVITINKASERPLYLQICDEVVRAIAAGELEAGDEMPSVRSLAADLGINLHTVNKAYATLRDKGHLVLRGRKRTLVAERPEPSESGSIELPEALAAELARIALEAKAQGVGEEALAGAVASIIGSVYGKAR